MKTVLQNCTIIIKTDKLFMPGEGTPGFTLEAIRKLINQASSEDIEISFTTNYWQGEPSPVIEIILK